MLDIVRTRVVAPPGSCHMYFVRLDADPRPANYGQNVHTAVVLLYAGDPLGVEMQEKAEATKTGSPRSRTRVCLGSGDRRVRLQAPRSVDLL